MPLFQFLVVPIPGQNTFVYLVDYGRYFQRASGNAIVMAVSGCLDRPRRSTSC